MTSIDLLWILYIYFTNSYNFVCFTVLKHNDENNLFLIQIITSLILTQALILELLLKESKLNLLTYLLYSY